MVQTEAGIGVALGLLVGIIAHEFVQHRVAYALGDKTPKLMGRLTISPKVHTDPIGTIIAPVIFVLSAFFRAVPIMPMFGWGKRHALNKYGLKQPKRDGVIIGLSGPVTSAVLAAVAGRLAGSVGSVGSDPVATALFWFAVANLFIAVFEILPLPGRDGARILGLYLSPSAASKLDDLAQWEIAFLVVFFLFQPLGDIINGMAGAACQPLTGLSVCLFL